MSPKLQSLYGLKFNPFRPDVPVEALHTTPAVDAFLRRVELGIADGGYVMITGDPGTGKSVALRLLSKRLEAMRDVVRRHPPPECANVLEKPTNRQRRVAPPEQLCSIRLDERAHPTRPTPRSSR